MPRIPRVAFLTDTFHEVNGAALTCRQLAAFARRRGYPFFSVRCGQETRLTETGNYWILEFRRGPLSLAVDADLPFDLLFYRWRGLLEKHLQRFQPDLIHIISPGELGILGVLAAHRLKVPLVASWHTNVHQYAARRSPFRNGAAARRIEEFTLEQILRIYRRAVALFAPSPELIRMLETRTGVPTFPMSRGVDSTAFSPQWRQREDSIPVIGYIGRLMPEKGVRFFALLESYLADAGERDFRLFIAGRGAEQRWLRRRLRHAEVHGILPPEQLSRAYANMDIFVFPSRTDTFGNVVQEALASAVPAVVTNSGGPRTIVEDGVTGLVAASDQEMCRHVLTLLRDPATRKRMGAAGRACMLTRSWDAVFEHVYQVYSRALADPGGAG